MHRPSIDHDLNNDLVRYLSTLSRDVSREVQRFQEFVFLSLLAEHGDSVVGVRKESELEEQETALIHIFKQFNMPEKAFMSKVNRYFQHAHSAFSKLRARERDIETRELAILLNTSRLIL